MLFFVDTQDKIFIRCIKPNKVFKNDVFDADYVTLQLKSSSVVEYLKLLQEGYPIQMESKHLLTLYEIFGKKEMQNSSFELLTILLRSTGLHRIDFKIGKTQVFFRPIRNLDAVLHPSQDMIRKTKEIFEHKLAIPEMWKRLTKKLRILHYSSNM